MPRYRPYNSLLCAYSGPKGPVFAHITPNYSYICPQTRLICLYPGLTCQYLCKETEDLPMIPIILANILGICPDICNYSAWKSKICVNSLDFLLFFGKKNQSSCTFFFLFVFVPQNISRKCARNPEDLLFSSRYAANPQGNVPRNKDSLHTNREKRARIEFVDALFAYFL